MDIWMDIEAIKFDIYITNLKSPEDTVNLSDKNLIPDAFVHDLILKDMRYKKNC